MSTNRNLDVVFGDGLTAELIAGYVIGDLNTEEQDRLERMIAENNSIRTEIERMEWTASRVYLSLVSSDRVAFDSAPLPESMRQRIASSATPFYHPSDESISSKVNGQRMAEATRDVNPSVPFKKNLTWREQVACLIAIAAMILAFCAWLPRLSDMTKIDGNLQGYTGNLIPDLDIPSERIRWIQSSQDLFVVKWAIPGEESKKSAEESDLGDIVWSSKDQKGYMRFTSLPPNDASKEQYQLWIVDPERDSKPVDGGVFDIARVGESVVPIQAKLKVGRPVLFAITIEKPGGVVVSDQSRLPLIAKVD